MSHLRSASPAVEKRWHRWLTKSEIAIKIVVVGGARVGKTCLVRRYLKNHFTEATLPTVAYDVSSLSLPTLRMAKSNSSFVLSIWDVSHAELQSPSHLELILDNVSGVICVLDACDYSSILAIDAWRAVCSQHFGAREVPSILIANKKDVTHRPTLLSSPVLDAYCRDAGFFTWKQVSARTGHGVKEAMDSLISSLVKLTIRTASAAALDRSHDADDAASASPPPHPQHAHKAVLSSSPPTTTSIEWPPPPQPPQPSSTALSSTIESFYSSLEARLAAVQSSAFVARLQTQRAHEASMLLARLQADDLAPETIIDTEVEFHTLQFFWDRVVSELQLHSALLTPPP